MAKSYHGIIYFNKPPERELQGLAVRNGRISILKTVKAASIEEAKALLAKAKANVKADDCDFV